MTRENAIAIIKQVLSGILLEPVSAIDSRKSFIDYGVDSIEMGEFITSLEDEFNLEISSSDFWGGSTVERLADAIVKKRNS
jgi:acyl carrier protein